MDYKELIERLKHCKSYKPKHELQRTMLDAATAIETLLAEREAAMKDLRRTGCDTCEHRKDCYPCSKCMNGSCWEWHGLMPDRKPES